VGHRGVWWAEVETFGRIAHGSMPFLGDSAIGHMAAFLSALERDLAPRLQSRCTCQPVMPPQARRSTLNINSVHGGQSEPRTAGNGGARDFLSQLPSPVVADSCRAVLDRRYLVEEAPDAVKREVLDILEQLGATRPGFRFAVRDIMEFEPTHTPDGAPVVEATRRAIRRVLGVEPQLIASPGTYDQKHIARSGKLRDCIAYGPGVLDLAHQPDEWVGIDDLVHSAQVMALAALDLLHAPR
jgi:succinyl-diaminopimelate desuccinylase